MDLLVLDRPEQAPPAPKAPAARIFRFSVDTSTADAPVLRGALDIRHGAPRETRGRPWSPPGSSHNSTRRTRRSRLSTVAHGTVRELSWLERTDRRQCIRARGTTLLVPAAG